jgi:hypothetical protein
LDKPANLKFNPAMQDKLPIDVGGPLYQAYCAVEKARKSRGRPEGNAAREEQEMWGLIPDVQRVLIIPPPGPGWVTSDVARALADELILVATAADEPLDYSEAPQALRDAVRQRLAAFPMRAHSPSTYASRYHRVVVSLLTRMAKYLETHAL